MRYRKLSPEGDYVFGAGLGEFLVDVPEAVGQAVGTRLLLASGEWFLDVNEGTPYATQILGTGTQQLYDQAVQERILDTPDVTGILKYSSTLDSKRKLTINCTIDTEFGIVNISGPAFSAVIPNPSGFFVLDVSTLDGGGVLA